MKVLLALALLLAGALSAVAAAAVHGRWWGLVLASVAVLLTLLALPPGWAGRLAFGLGFALVVGRLAVPRPEGDFVVAADPAGWTLLGLTLVVVLLAVATLPRPGARPADT